jgi:hypothetical protein
MSFLPFSALTARTQFGQILRRVKQKNERFLVGRRGEPQAIIIGIVTSIHSPQHLHGSKQLARKPSAEASIS